MKRWIINPWLQLGVALWLLLLVLVAVRPDTANSAWFIAGLSYVFFILANTAISFAAPKGWAYFGWSILASFAALLVLSGLTVVWIQIFGPTGPGEGAMIFLVFIYHPGLLLAGLGIRALVGRITK